MKQAEDAVEEIMGERFNPRPDFPPAEGPRRAVEAVLAILQRQYKS